MQEPVYVLHCTSYYLPWAYNAPLGGALVRQFHSHILKNRTMLFPTTFISMSEKIGVGLLKQVAIFYFSFAWEMSSPVFLF